MVPETQMSWTAALLGVAAALAVGLTAPGWRAAGALALGVVLSLGNFAWLKAGARAITTYGSNQPLRSGVVRFILRFWLLAACLYAIFISHLVPMMWVVAGLFAVPAAVLVESTRMLLQPDR